MTGPMEFSGTSSMRPALLIGILGLSCLGAGPEAAPLSSFSESDWSVIRADRDAAIQRYFNAAGDGYRWFAHSLHGEGAGTPFLLMRVFPELAPDIWKPP